MNANWNGFREYTEEKYADVQEASNSHLAKKKTFRTTKAARKFILSGSFKEIRPNIWTIGAPFSQPT